VIDRLARDIAAAGEGTRQVAVLGAQRNVGTTITAITLARVLAKQGRVILIDLALGAPNLSAIAADPGVPGIGELVNGAATFGEIITRDRYSRVHLITVGRLEGGADEIMGSARLSITLQALARAYEYVVIDAGTVADARLDRLAELARRAVLVANEPEDPSTVSAQEQLAKAGFSSVTVLAREPRGPQSDSDGTRAAA
jgi:MinD-like ATPase involved in chromosome partitioning or flagellar assembly